MGYHRDSFYEIKRAFQVGGVAGLLEQKRGPKSPPPNRVSPEIEREILEYSLTFPTRGQARVANDLRMKGLTVNSGGFATSGCDMISPPDTGDCCDRKRPRRSRRWC